ncbi:MAG TPA: DUF1176 domain-containing protein, partial [Caulobacteraceae bacterium]
MRRGRAFAGLASLAAILFAASAHAAGKTVKDWTAACDNLGACTAFGFSAEGDENPGYLIIHRDAGGGAAPAVQIVFDVGDTQPSTTWTIAVDDHAIPGIGPLQATGSESGARTKLGPAAGAALIRAVRNGDAIDVASGGKPVTSISLSGSAAILLWLDVQQGRVGTVTALGKPSSGAASAVPPPRPTPVIVAAPPVDQKGLPAHAPRSMAKLDPECDTDGSSADVNDTVARLAPGVVLWGPMCTSGAYNEVSIFFIGDEHGHNLKRVKFPEAPGSKQATDDQLFNAEYDPKTRTIAA